MNSEKLNKEEINGYLDLLYKRRDFVENIKIKAGDSFDKYLLTFSTGSLYLSIIFISSFKEYKSLEFLSVLAIGWLVFLISIISSLLSIFFTIYAHNRQISLIDQDIQELQVNGEVINGKNCFNSWITFFQISAISGFIAGIAILSIFFMLNIK
jgi:hypothetical protein